MRSRWRTWCTQRVVLPAFLLVFGNNTTNPTVSCQDGPAPTKLSPFLEWTRAHWFALLLVTVALVASIGVYLAVQYERWRQALDGQLELGVLTEEEHRRLR